MAPLNAPSTSPQVSMNQICFPETPRWLQPPAPTENRKILHFGITENASAPRDRGQTVGHTSSLPTDITALPSPNSHKETARCGGTALTHAQTRGLCPATQRAGQLFIALHVPLTAATGMPPRPLCLSPTS